MKEKALKNNPVDRSNIISQLCFCWLLPYFVKGYKKVLTEDDMYKNRSVHDSEVLGNKLERVWNKNTTLAKALYSVFFGEFIGICCIAVISEICRMFQPLLISRMLVLFDENRSSDNLKNIYINAGLLILFSTLAVSTYHYFSLQVQQIGMKMRIACSSLIYRKALKLNHSAFSKTSAGQIVTLLSNDVGRLENTSFLNQLFMAPIETIVVMVLIYISVGWYGLLGAVCLILSIFASALFGKKSGQLRFATAQKTDKRILLVNQILSGIEVVKMFAWEKFVGKQVQTAREREIQQLRQNSIVRGLSIFNSLAVTKLAIFLSVISYALTGNVLNSSYVFTLTTFYRLLQTATMFFPIGAAQFAEMIASIRRIQQYLLHEDSDNREMKDLEKFTEEEKKNLEGPITSEPYGVIELVNVSAKWPNSSSDTIQDINLKIPSGGLITIIGPSGSGKTTLLNIILQELSPIRGSVKVSGIISYASQEPWLFGETLRENILFGEPYNEKKYNEVVKVCALEKDFSALHFGDGTLTGDRGLSLSGGQRARINLARAIYRDADIYLLDDPLSAVDNSVGKHIFEMCILGYLKNRTVVLVTHQIQYLKNIDSIYLLKDGSLVHFNSYGQLKEHAREYVHDIADTLDQIEEKQENKILVEGTETKNFAKQTQELVKEERSKGKVSVKVYKLYFLACGHWFRTFVMVSLFVIAQFLDSLSEYFLSFWINTEQNNFIAERLTYQPVVNQTGAETNDSISNPQEIWCMEMIFHGHYPVICYTILIVLMLLFTFSKSIYFFLWSIKISTRMHRKMFNKVVYNPMSFFNQNPSGRILNRFSKDMSIIDEVIPATLMDTLHIGISMVSICIIIGSLNIWTLVPSAVIFLVSFHMRKVFLETSRDIKRIESVNRAPMYTHLTQSLQGITIIRTFKVQEKFKKEFDMYQNIHSSAFFMFMSAARTYGFWLDMLAVVYVGLVIFFLLVVKKETFGGNIGLALSQAMWLMQALQRGMRQWGEFENQMISVERVQEYMDLEPEVDNQKEPPEFWPQNGRIDYKDIILRYSKASNPALNGVNLTINPKERIGIVGRTGAGKTSLLRVLLRLVDFDGSVLIDGVSSQSISLQSLRTKISVISQVPLLFSGTLRHNLDPFEKHDDEVLWGALEEVEMKLKVQKLPESLNTAVAEGGANFSIGERQLLCLARAIIDHNKILFLDEATSNVDPQTDKLIQKTIRLKFSDCTVLTIAHRLQTVMDSDRVLVMDNGKVVEFDRPDSLLKKKDGHFYSLVRQSVQKDDQEHLNGEE